MAAIGDDAQSPTPAGAQHAARLFEEAEFAAILTHLPETALHAPLKFAYHTGWRFRSEVLPLTADRVDLRAGFVHLDINTTKSGEGRSFYLTADLRAVLQAQIDSLEALKKDGVICAYVFHRDDGSQIKDFRKAWKNACTDAGYPGKIFHDFRRTAVRNLERANVPRSTAMKMIGHETESIYHRYAIQDEAMLREASARIDAWTDAQRTASKPKAAGQLKKFEKRRA
jgi:integrase